MARHSKRFGEIRSLCERGRIHTLDEAIDLLKRVPPPRFDESVDLSLRLGIDPKKSDQQVRSTVLLPHGIGKNPIVVVLARGEKVTVAKEAGADFVGDKDLIEKIGGGWVDFDALVVTPDMMREVGKLGKILGPRGLMPTPKAGTVTADPAKATGEIKKGKVEFKVDKNGIINSTVGKLSFLKEKIVENVEVFVQAVLRAKPTTAKGHYLRGLFLSSTMGPGIKVDVSSLPGAN
ncbi:MAG: 50S ribosomal protein L1 [Simkaniaceae bacterium]|nr:50S ribosomal protein L1 [Simkaniaceae bacterium]